MTVTTHEIMLKTESKSKARILGKHLKSHVVGHEFEVLFELTNIGSIVFPGGDFTVNIEWPNGQEVIETLQIPVLNPGNMHKTSPLTTEALSRGFALLTLGGVRANDKKPVKFCKESGESIVSGPPRTVYAFYTILAKEPEEIYQFWAMLLSAVSLVFLVGIELIRFLMWLGTVLK